MSTKTTEPDVLLFNTEEMAERLVEEIEGDSLTLDGAEWGVASTRDLDIVVLERWPNNDGEPPRTVRVRVSVEIEEDSAVPEAGRPKPVISTEQAERLVEMVQAGINAGADGTAAESTARGIVASFIHGIGHGPIGVTVAEAGGAR